MPVSTQYFAYGSNMDVEQMAHRCPDAKKISVATLVGYRFAINDHGVATVIPTPDVNTEGVLWSISPTDKVSLDRYEGVKTPVATSNSPTFGRSNSPRQDGLIINQQCHRAQGARWLL